MTIYTVALLVRTVADGLSAVPDDIAQAATAMGYKGVRRLFGVELPLAAPVIAAGLRVAAVSNVSIVSIASLIGVSQLGDLLIDGYNRVIWGELITGIVSCVLLALAFDAVIVLGTRLADALAARAGGAGMISSILAWFTDPANWQGEDGIPHRMLQHLEYTAMAVLLAAVDRDPARAVGRSHRAAALAGVAGQLGARRADPRAAVRGVAVARAEDPGRPGVHDPEHPGARRCSPSRRCSPAPTPASRRSRRRRATRLAGWG